MIVLTLVLIFIALLGLRSDLERIARALERVGRIDRCVQNIKDADAARAIFEERRNQDGL